MIERLLMGSNSTEKMQAISLLVTDLGLEPHGALVRIFNRGLLENVRTFGTDRAGLDEIDVGSEKFDMLHGYDKALHRKQLRLDDGMFACLFDHFADRFPPTIFEEITLGISPHRIAIAIYRANMMVPLTDQFFYFADPTKKKEALLAVLLQPPLPIEKGFADLSLEAKEAFLRENQDKLNRKNIDIFLELAKDLVHFTRTNHLTASIARAQAIFDAIEQHEIELNVIDECWQQVYLLQKTPDHPGISKKLIVDRISKLGQNPADFWVKLRKSA